MIKVVAKFTLQKDKVDEFLDLSTELVEKTRKEQGCISYELFQDVNDSSICTFIETWESQEALSSHGKEEHFTRIIPKLSALLREKAIVNSYQLIK